MGYDAATHEVYVGFSQPKKHVDFTSENDDFVNE